MQEKVKGWLQSDTAKGLIVLIIGFLAKTFLNLDDVSSQELAQKLSEAVMAIGGAWAAMGARNAVSDTKVVVKPIVKDAEK